MGMFGSRHGSADSTTSSKTWGADTGEKIIMSGYMPQWYYQDETLAPINPAMQQILDYELSANPFNNARSIIGKGKGTLANGVNEAKELAGISGDDILTKWKSMTATGYADASNFMETQDEAIENRVNAEMGNELGASAEYNNNVNGGTYTSGALNENSAIVANSAESMKTQESEMAMKIARMSGSSSANAIKSALRVKAGEAGITARAGLGEIGVGANALDKAFNNAWQAGSFETAREQKQMNVDRKNNMVNNNLTPLEQTQWWRAFEQAQGWDTTSTTHTSY